MATAQVRRQTRRGVPAANAKPSVILKLLMGWFVVLGTAGTATWFLLSSHWKERPHSIPVAETVALVQAETDLPSATAEQVSQLKAAPSQGPPSKTVVFVDASIPVQPASSAEPFIGLEKFTKPFNKHIKALEELCAQTRTNAFVAADSKQVTQEKHELQQWLDTFIGRQLTVQIPLQRANFGKALILFPESSQLVFAIKGPSRETTDQSATFFIPIHDSRTKPATDRYWNTVLEEHHYPKDALRQHKDEELLRRLAGYSKRTFEGTLQARVTAAQLGNGGQGVDDYIVILDLDDVQVVDIGAPQEKEEPKVATKVREEERVSRKRFTGF